MMMMIKLHKKVSSDDDENNEIKVKEKLNVVYFLEKISEPNLSVGNYFPSFYFKQWIWM